MRMAKTVAATRASASRARQHGVPIIVVSALAFAGWTAVAVASINSASHEVAHQVEQQVQNEDEAVKYRGYEECVQQKTTEHEPVEACGSP